jgi:hypothetical protein
MGESSGTNLKPVPPILFLKQAYENLRVLVLRLDSWHERPRSTSTPRGHKVLRKNMQKVMKYLYLSGLIHYFEMHSTVATLVNYARSFSIVAATFSHIKMFSKNQVFCGIYDTKLEYWG